MHNPNSVSLSISNCTFVATSLGPFAGLFLNPAVYECALKPEIAAFRRFVE